jgi:surfeit locus 1 family protein
MVQSIRHRPGLENRMSGFRPRLFPALFTIAVVLVCGGLGLWQLQRMEWKRALIAQREAAVAAAPVAPPHTLADARALEFHRVVADGVFRHDKEILLNAIGPKGGAGFGVLTPLSEAGGGTLFVLRGFVPTELKDPAKRAAGQPSGTVRVAGLLRLPPEHKPNWFVPDNRSELGNWFWIDLRAMGAADGLADMPPFYIEADATPNPGGWPKGGVTPLVLPNDHLQYAITWFSLAVVAIVIYLLSQRRATRGKTSDDQRLPGT